MSTLSEKERQELSLLLPWYANGTLDEAESRMVEAALAKDDALAREFDLVLEDQATMVELVSEEEVPLSMEARFKAALHAEAHEPAAEIQPVAPGESFLGRLTTLLFSERPRAYAFVAAAVVMLLPAIAVYSIMSVNQQNTGQYQTASGEQDSAIAKERLLVQFKANLAWADIDAFLKENGAQVVKGPSADGLYELEFEQAEDLVERMGAEFGIFEFVLPAN